MREFYTPTSEEIAFARSKARSPKDWLSLLLLLKAFQRLGYFPAFESIPSAISQHIGDQLNLSAQASVAPSLRSRRRYEQVIRTFLEVNPYNSEAQKVVTQVVLQAAQVQDHPADLINIAIETLVKERYELPAFSTIDRLVRKLRNIVNTRLFKRVSSLLSDAEATYLDQLLVRGFSTSEINATLNDLKAIPKDASFSHIKELQAKFDRLMAFGDTQKLLHDIPAGKVKYFAALAGAMDISEFKDIKQPKRRTLLLCLLHHAQIKAKDHLGEMFLKRLGSIHKSAKNLLIELREQHRAMTEKLLSVLNQLLTVTQESDEAADLGDQVLEVVKTNGGTESLLSECEIVAACTSDNHLPLLWRFYRNYRGILFRIVCSLDVHSATQEQTLMSAVEFLLENEHCRKQYLPLAIDLDFLTEPWKRLVIDRRADGTQVLNRQQFEICIFSYLATELKTGDAYIPGSSSFADYREQLLSWEECQPLLAEYCAELGFPTDAQGFIEQLRQQLTEAAEAADTICQAGDQITISEQGEPVLKRIKAQPQPDGADALETAVLKRMPERSILDILCNVEHWLNWTRHFGPISGSEPKLDMPQERYILTTFAYGCNLGPNETARHTRGRVTSHMLSYTNRRHIDTPKLEKANRDIINSYNRFNLPKFWGTGKHVAADGSPFDTYHNNLVAEYHIRYGHYGGIGYHHISDTYIALFSHFITCGVWEAVYILDELLKNTSDIQPDTIHADTQGQSTPAFALAHLLGIKLMPRIRNWKDLNFYRPCRDTNYQFIDPLFSEVVNWSRIETHWQDFMRVVLSIRAGKLMPSTLLRKLGAYSRKNRLYQAFQELGQVIRTIFLLKFISDRGLRQLITACTNKVEAYHNFLDWIAFGKEGVITENDPDEQEKRIKYLELVANAVILQNTVDISYALQGLMADGYPVKRDAIPGMSPYMTRQLKRYGDFVLELNNIPESMEAAMKLIIDE